MSEAKPKYVIAWGNLVDGHYFIGTFDSADEATAYAESDAVIRDSEWRVILLQEPAS